MRHAHRHPFDTGLWLASALFSPGGTAYMKTQFRVLATAAAVAMIAGCATPGGGYYGQQYPQQQYPQGQQEGMSRTSRGALIGAAVGTVAGLLSGSDATERRQRALVGAGVGGLAGGAIGNYQDRQERALREQMAGTGIDVVRLGDNITLNMPVKITFDFDSSTLKSQFYPALDNRVATGSEYGPSFSGDAGHTNSKVGDS